MPTHEMGRLVWNFELPNSADGKVVQHFRKPSLAALTNTDLDEAMAVVKDCWLGDGDFTWAMRDLFNNNCTLLSLTATAIGNTPMIQRTLSVASTGSGTGVALPAESAVVVSWYTDFIGKSYRGRSFFPGIEPDTLGNDGKLLPTPLTNWGTVVSELLTEFNTETAANLELSVYSQVLDEMNAIESATVRATLHHQSRRNS